jgi:hypothetical protein
MLGEAERDRATDAPRLEPVTIATLPVRSNSFIATPVRRSDSCLTIEASTAASLPPYQTSGLSIELRDDVLLLVQEIASTRATSAARSFLSTGGRPRTPSSTSAWRSVPAPQRLGLVDRCRGAGRIVDRLDEHAASPTDDGAEQEVDAPADHDLEAAADHFLHEKSVDRRPRGVAPRIRGNLRACLLDRMRIREAETDDSGLGLVR